MAAQSGGESRAVSFCTACASENQREFVSEMVIHFSGLQDLKKRKVLAFPKLRVCMDCGFTESTLRETELRHLGKDAAEQVGPASLTPASFTPRSPFEHRWIAVL